MSTCSGTDTFPGDGRRGSKRPGQGECWRTATALCAHECAQGQRLARPPHRDQVEITARDGRHTDCGGQGRIHGIRPVARSKVASLPVGADVTFLIDELNKIVDVTLGTTEKPAQAAAQGHKQSLIKGNLRQVAGVIMKVLEDKTVRAKPRMEKNTHFGPGRLFWNDSPGYPMANRLSCTLTTKSKWRMSPSTSRRKGSLDSLMGRSACSRQKKSGLVTYIRTLG